MYLAAPTFCQLVLNKIFSIEKLIAFDKAENVPSFKANICGEVAVRKAGYGVVQNNVDMVETDNLKYMDDSDNEVATFKRGKEQLWCYGITKDICLVSVQSSNGDRNIELPGQNEKNVKSIINSFVKINRGSRLGCTSGGFNSIQKHKFFKEIDWPSCRLELITPPMIPTIVTDGDTGNFDIFPPEGPEEAGHRGIR
jgi:hypothetical protein